MQGLLKADKCNVQTLLSVMGVEHLEGGVGWGWGGGGPGVNCVGANGTGANGTIWGEW